MKKEIGFTRKHQLTCSRRRRDLQDICFRRRTVPLPLPPQKLHRKKSAILWRFCRIRADTFSSDTWCSHSHTEVVYNPHMSLGGLLLTLTVLRMHPIFPLLQGAHNAEGPTSAIVETTLPIQSEALRWNFSHRGPRVSHKWWVEWSDTGSCFL